MMSLETWIGLRYLRAKGRSGYVSFISLISVLGIALGVIALITVLSVMNGFQKEIRGQVLNVAPHIEVGYLDEEQSTQWPELIQKFKSNPEVLAAAPYVSGQALLAYSGEVRGAQLKGIDPKLETTVVEFAKDMPIGKFSDLSNREFNIILGTRLARDLDVNVGEKVTVITPEGNVTPAGVVPRLKQFTVVGLVSTNVPEVDASLAMIHIQDAQKLFRLGDGVTGVRLKLKNPQNAPTIASTLLSGADLKHYWISDWTYQNRSYFEAVELEKRMMSIILTLIIAVAAFNLVSSLVMSVNEKQADIAILRTLGLPPLGITKIFMLQGTILGTLGTLFGVVFGCLLAWKVGVLVRFFEELFGLHLINQQIYFIDYLPSDIKLMDVVTIACVSLVLSFLATIYPSYRAAKTHPAEALRYE